MKWFIGILFTMLLGHNGLSQTDYTAMRQTMVESQLKARGIFDKNTLKAMSKVPRHLFVPENQQIHAYSDGPLPIGMKQTISQPYMVAFMTQAIKPWKNKKVLEIGTGSGYQAAILAEIVDSVYTIEIIPELGKRAEKLLQSMQYENVKVRVGDGYDGWPEQAPFDAIIVTAGAEQIPEPLVEQLKDGGRMVIPVGPHHGVRDLILLTKKNDKIKKKSLMAVRFVPFTRND
ncbi:protein-L-isoaspartate(D-aspartate) O-methyltransferase [Allomuricauda sp. SCSIO 65647]|uniref:protein-L-isoaspartate(D-aspartate) O-methyltransferase n=1 Tax=Allomuricauda sp. SCSIO 65647 TaxID=2908843 RepID=UPI001F2D2B86|nr:protein-L-isoaspartate(D-aspartate) O-methyltransferase [Muricauda sp. SCSIO 65647]UJH67324.1 protein-L-isoaspartate(D-aspartate) O-methyltransferase [Muricauda sp. SCSIO 65647]